MPSLTYLECTSFMLADTCRHTCKCANGSDRITLPSLVTLKIAKGWIDHGDKNNVYPFVYGRPNSFSAPNLKTIDLTDCDEYFPLDDLVNIKCIRGLSLQNLLPSKQNVTYSLPDIHLYVKNHDYLATRKPFYRVLETLEMHFNFLSKLSQYDTNYDSPLDVAVLLKSLLQVDSITTLIINAAYCSSLEHHFPDLLKLRQVKVLELHLVEWPAEYEGRAGFKLIREYLVNSMKSYHEVDELIDQGMRVVMYTPNGRYIMFTLAAYLIREHTAQDTKEGTPVDFSVRFQELQFDFVLIHYAQHQEEYLRLERHREIAKLWLD
jgi:hypothetical protein